MKENVGLNFEIIFVPIKKTYLNQEIDSLIEPMRLIFVTCVFLSLLRQIGEGGNN